jgi:hypothetical protein
MPYQTRQNYQRGEDRVNFSLPAQIRIGTQLAIQGKLKDLSLRSAFILMKTSVYLQTNDEVGFAIQRSADNVSDLIEGWARISRLAPGEGLAIYFTRMDETSTNRLRELLNV